MTVTAKAEAMLSKYKNRGFGWYLSIPVMVVRMARHFHTRQRPYRSETSKCRARLAPLCLGYGLDLGFGGDSITRSAIRVDLPQPYALTGRESVQLGGRAESLAWFRDGVLDYVYSSHLLEDYEDTLAVLREWTRVLKPGGRLILFCPDQKRYEQHCRKTNQIPNQSHKQADFSLAYVKSAIAQIGDFETLHENPLVDIYSWELAVVKKCAA